MCTMNNQQAHNFSKYSRPELTKKSVKVTYLSKIDVTHQDTQEHWLTYLHSLEHINTIDVCIKPMTSDIVVKPLL